MSNAANVTNPIKRRLSVGLSVGSVKDIPKAGVYLKRFLDEVDIAHGPFALDVVMSVGGAELPEPPIEITFVPGEGRAEDHEEEGV